MTLFRTYSKMQIAKIFAVNRSTVYGWEIRGCPIHQASRPGRPAKMNFDEVLKWYLTQEEIKGVSEEGLELLEQTIVGRKREYYG
ncbi:hypothetical protein [Nitrospira sp. BLG_2]|uniref:hypothetical protein n=1 Tax=Nitrospira sp. BLG_2 TaxID=3397507 RepID=UPI003B9C2BBA